MAVLKDFEEAARYATSETKAQIENIITRRCKVANVRWKAQETAPPWYKLRVAEIGHVETVLL